MNTLLRLKSQNSTIRTQNNEYCVKILHYCFSVMNTKLLAKEKNMATIKKNKKKHKKKRVSSAPKGRTKQQSGGSCSFY